MIKVSIVIPCYNEALNIPILIEKLESTSSPGLEYVLVNNGSNDNTLEMLKANTSSNSMFKIVNVEKNIGYGNGINCGLKEAKGNVLGWIHADLQYEPNVILELLKYIPVGKKNWFIKGHRQNRPWNDQLFTAMMSVFESLLFQARLWDINAQPTLFNSELYNNWSRPPNDFSLDLYAFLVALRNGAKVYRVPVEVKNRAYGESSWNRGFISKIRLIKRTITYSFRLRACI